MQVGFIDKLKKLKNLKTLIVTDIPSIDDLKMEDIIVQIGNIEFFNFMKAEDLRKQAILKKKDDRQGAESSMKQLQEEKKKAKKKKRGDKNDFYFPTLEQLCYNLEAANSHPSRALDHLKDLA